MKEEGASTQVQRALARRDGLRNAGFVACLVGSLTMIGGRFAAGGIPLLASLGLAIVVLGWGLFALSVYRRRTASRGVSPRAEQ